MTSRLVRQLSSSSSPGWLARLKVMRSQAFQWLRASLRRTNVAAAQARRPLLDTRAIFKDVLLGNTAPLLLGFSLGGLFSSIMTVLYIGEQERRRVAKGEDVETGYELPHPKLASFGWTLLGAFATVSIGLTRAHLKHTLKHFVEHVNFSLNIFRDGRFSFRTIHETHVTDIFRDNERAGSMLIAAARQTGSSKPFMMLPEKERRYLATAIINTLSPAATPGFFAMERGDPVCGGWYKLALTFEEDMPDEKARKIRVLIASEDMLTKVAQLPLDSPPPILDFPTQQYRWKTIVKMANLFAEEQRTGIRNPYLIGVQLVWPHPSPCMFTSLPVESPTKPLGSSEV